jgi:urea transport system substrate-binding protein
MSRRLVVGVVVTVLGLTLVFGAWAAWDWWFERRPILVGLLHSQTGPWASTEQAMLDAELLAIEEINAAGGLLGHPVRAVVADGRSNPGTFAEQARQLIRDVKVSVLIGCWTAEARRAVRPVVEEAQHLLIYPPSFEGLEESPSIVYTGGPTNQNILPAVSWCRNQHKARKFFVIGSDSFSARAQCAQLKDQLHALRGELVGEAYLGRPGTDGSGSGSSSDRDRVDANEAVRRIEQAAPDVVISLVEGTDNAAFYGRLRRAGIAPGRTPVVSLSLGEEDVRRLPIADVVGQYAAWNYFQSIDRPENRDFIRRFREKYGADRVISDHTQIAYQSVRIWAQTVVEANSADVDRVSRDLARQSLNAPEGIISIDADNRQGWRPFFLGRVQPDGQFEIVWSLTKPIRPIPYPATRSRAEWDALVDELKDR